MKWQNGCQKVKYSEKNVSFFPMCLAKCLHIVFVSDSASWPFLNQSLYKNRISTLIGQAKSTQVLELGKDHCVVPQRKNKWLKAGWQDQWKVWCSWRRRIIENRAGLNPQAVTVWEMPGIPLGTPTNNRETLWQGSVSGNKLDGRLGTLWFEYKNDVLISLPKQGLWHLILLGTLEKTDVTKTELYEHM